MNKRELERIKKIDLEIIDLMDKLYSITSNSQVKGQIISDMPRGGERKDSMFEYVCKKTEIETAIKELNAEKEALIEKANKFLRTIEDKEVRSIIQKRVFLGETFEQIGYSLDMDKSTVCRKFNNFFRQREIEEMKRKFATNTATKVATTFC